MDRISELPEDILHRILYFLSQEDAVRTSVLSKSWRYIWRTRPNLDFSDNTKYYKGGKKKQEFLSVVNTTLQGYCDQRLCVDEFRLRISSGDYSDHEFVSLLDKWIPLLTATTMGVKEFQLSILSKNSVRGIVHLPVVLKAEPLKLLWLYDCSLGQNIPENIPFVRLQVLRLQSVSIEQQIFDKIISSCPLLTDMWLQKCGGLKTIALEKKLHRYLKHVSFVSHEMTRDESIVEIDDDVVPTLETIHIKGCKIRFRNVKFGSLKSLYLSVVEISTDNSVEQSQQPCIDAPDLKYFKYTGSFIPSVSFVPTCMKSNLQLYMRGRDGQPWFLRLSQLLRALRRSEISLTVVRFSRDELQIEEEILVHDTINNGGGNYKPVVVEHLTLHIRHLSSYLYVLNVLFCICRPRNINPSWFSQRNGNKEKVLKELGECLRKIEKMRESGGNREMWRDLEDITIQGSDESRRKWKRLQVANLSGSGFSNFRVRLQWSDISRL
ncbi:hypothetical protein ABFS83_05G050900 [Erythranthe nasuta]